MVCISLVLGLRVLLTITWVQCTRSQPVLPWMGLSSWNTKHIYLGMMYSFVVLFDLYVDPKIVILLIHITFSLHNKKKTCLFFLVKFDNRSGHKKEE